MITGLETVVWVIIGGIPGRDMVKTSRRQSSEAAHLNGK